MSTREKIILILAAVVVIIGLYYLLVADSAPKSNNQNDSLAQSEILPRIDKESKELLKAQQAMPREIIRQISRTWPRDPFYAPPQEKVEQREKEEGEQPINTGPLVYSGFVQSKEAVYAVINNMEYAIGEKVEPQGFIVQEITPGQVILQKGGQKITLPLVDSFFPANQ